MRCEMQYDDPWFDLSHFSPPDLVSILYNIVKFPSNVNVDWVIGDEQQ